ncbi:MAG: hypothetical protein M0R00_02750 [Candidatus Omnitrophica bacterium]|nr:hypothetical protein [Candidatus Omnitrophota bacterium]
MKKSAVHTIILQEAEIARLIKRNQELESAHRVLYVINRRLRLQIKTLERRENELSNINI